MSTDITHTQSDKPNKREQVSCLGLNYTNVAHGRYFVVTVQRGNFSPDSYCRHYYHPSRASLLRINRAQRLLIRRVDGDGYVADLPAVTVEPEDNTELAQLVTTEYEAALLPGVPMCALPDCLDGAEPGRDRWRDGRLTAARAITTCKPTLTTIRP